MNPFEYINDMKQMLRTEVKEKGIQPNDTITQKEHYTRMLNMLNILEEELKNAEYNYQIESVNGEITTFDELAVNKSQLNDDVIIFQPSAVTEDFSMIDMQSLADVLTKLRDDGQIKENIILLPPDIGVFKAKLTNNKE